MGLQGQVCDPASPLWEMARVRAPRALARRRRRDFGVNPTLASLKSRTYTAARANVSAPWRRAPIFESVGGHTEFRARAREIDDDVAFSDESAAVIGTPDDLAERIRDMTELTGGFGCVIGFVHDWANREDTLRSWDMVARYVVPQVNGMLDGYLESYKFVNENRETWKRANEARTSAINSHERAAQVMEREGLAGEKAAADG